MTGLNVQVAVTLTGTLVWVSDPLPGRTHDVEALRQSGLLATDIPIAHIGLGMLTPFRKPPAVNSPDRCVSQQRFGSVVGPVECLRGVT
ncbi:MAG: transposase family protein [Bifidobacteriaceae bacterium]|jgi:hypothetical protein|nr:transposase family protein [Bifidobacteriaceae bacterium]